MDFELYTTDNIGNSKNKKLIAIYETEKDVFTALMDKIDKICGRKHKYIKCIMLNNNTKIYDYGNDSNYFMIKSPTKYITYEAKGKKTKIKHLRGINLWELT